MLLVKVNIMILDRFMDLFVMGKNFYMVIMGVEKQDYLEQGLRYCSQHIRKD